MPDLSEYLRRQVESYGDDPRSAAWFSRESQERRFALVAEVVEDGDSVLDVGCGMAHLYEYLRRRSWAGSYAGVDPLAEMVAVARDAGRPAQVGDAAAVLAGLDDLPRQFDVVVSCGVVSMQLGSEDERRAWLADHLADLARLARRVVVLNFLSGLAASAWSERWSPSPGTVLDMALRHAPRATVRHDYYGDYDCTLLLYVPGPA